MTQSVTYTRGRIFDGARFFDDHELRFENGQFASIVPNSKSKHDGRIIDLEGDIVFPGFVDLQVNGGGGVLFNNDPSLATLSRIAAAHRRLGVTAFLPTLITDTTENTRAAIAAAIEAVRSEVPGIAGLHLEGPHLSVARKGAHDGTLIRPLTDGDLNMLLAAAKDLPILKVTVAPESVSEDQVSALASAGVLVSLGHSDADFETCCRYFAAGARCATHLFNAMSQLGSRDPGLVGAALSCGDVSAGLIADMVHVHPTSIHSAWLAKRGPGRIFLVSDAMAVAGSDATEFELGGRLITRTDGVLTLADGTLAGADLDLLTAVRGMVEQVGLDLAEVLQASTSIPSKLIGRSYGFGHASGVVRVRKDLSNIF